MKHQQNDLTNVLHRPVETAASNGPSLPSFRESAVNHKATLNSFSGYEDFANNGHSTPGVSGASLRVHWTPLLAELPLST